MKYVIWVCLGIIMLFVVSMCNLAVNTGSKVVKKTLDTDNIIQSYEWFYDVNAAYEARLGQIRQWAEMMRPLPNEVISPAEMSRLRVEMGAIQQTCRELATKYNANSEKMNKSIFKGWSLPETLSIQQCEVKHEARLNPTYGRYTRRMLRRMC